MKGKKNARCEKRTLTILLAHLNFTIQYKSVVLTF